VTYRFFSDNIHVPIGVKVQSISPTSILIKLEPIKHRDVPVKLELRGTPPDGYRITHVELKPAVVRISGAETKVDAVTEVSTTPVDVTGIRQTLEREVSLDLMRHGVQVEGALPKVVIQMDPVSANFRIKNIDVRVITPYKVRMDEKTVTILVRADAKNLKSLDRGKVYAVVDLTGKARGKYREGVKVTLPEDIGLVKVIPDQVDVTLY
jgi:YbbR domain-containing protein